MNVKYLLSSFVLASVALTSCTDLDTAPEGNTVTSDQKNEIIGAKPERGEAGVRAIFSTLNQYCPNYVAMGKSTRHSDFGYGSVLYFTDANTEDQSAGNNGYNWSGNSLQLSLT